MLTGIESWLLKFYLFCKPFDSPHHYGITSITVESFHNILGEGKTFNRREEKVFVSFNKIT